MIINEYVATNVNPNQVYIKNNDSTNQPFIFIIFFLVILSIESTLLMNGQTGFLMNESLEGAF